jgi:hypothetical protein
LEKERAIVHLENLEKQRGHERENKKIKEKIKNNILMI